MLRYDNSIVVIKVWGKLKEIEEVEVVFDKFVEKYKFVFMLLYFFFMEIYIENKMLMKGKNFVKRIVSVGVKIGFLMWYVFVKFYIKVGEVGKVEMILNKVMSDNKMRLLFIFYMVIFEEYVKRGDVYNVEKVFMRMKRVGYVV